MDPPESIAGESYISQTRSIHQLLYSGWQSGHAHDYVQYKSLLWQPLPDQKLECSNHGSLHRQSRLLQQRCFYWLSDLLQYQARKVHWVSQRLWRGKYPWVFLLGFQGRIGQRSTQTQLTESGVFAAQKWDQQWNTRICSRLDDREL